MLVLVTLAGHIFMRVRQRRLAGRRPNLSEEEFVATLEPGRRDIGQKVYRAFASCCGGGIAPHPEDDITTFYAIDDEELVHVMVEIAQSSSESVPSTVEGGSERPRTLVELIDMLASLPATTYA